MSAVERKAEDRLLYVIALASYTAIFDLATSSLYMEKSEELLIGLQLVEDLLKKTSVRWNLVNGLLTPPIKIPFWRVTLRSEKFLSIIASYLFCALAELLVLSASQSNAEPGRARVQRFINLIVNILSHF